jgi:hypothetical protein
MPGRKIDEARVRILYLDANAVELLERLPEPVRRGGGLLLEFAHRARTKPAAVSGHAHTDRSEATLELGETPACGHKALDRRPDDRQGGVRFLRREEPHERDTS